MKHIGILTTMLIVLIPGSGCQENTLSGDEAQPTPETVRRLPAASGPHDVGTTIFEWTDESRPEGATEDPNDARHLRVQLWYPAARGGQNEPYPFFPDLDAYQATFTNDYADSLRDFVSDAALDATPRVEGGPYPLVIFFHGWNLQRSSYTSLLVDLASHGYVVAGVDQPWAGRVLMPDGSVTEASDLHFESVGAMLSCYGDDYLFVVDRLLSSGESSSRFRGLIDAGRIGVAGHSNGGITAAQASHLDDRVRAVVLLDSFDSDVEQHYLLDVPLLLVRTGGAKPPSASYLDAIRATVDDIVISGGAHVSATDWPYVEAKSDEERADAARTGQAIREVVVAFFDRHIADRPGTIGDVSDESAAIVQVELHTPDRD